MAKKVRMPHYPKGIEKELSSLVTFMIERISSKFKNQVLLGMHKSTINKFEDKKQVGNYANVFSKLVKSFEKKVFKQFSKKNIDNFVKTKLNKADSFNKKRVYGSLESLFGIDANQLIKEESMSPTINALISSTSEWVERLRDETLQDFSAASLRQMTLGRTVDELIDNLNEMEGKKKNAAKFVARNQISNFNGLLTKLRYQKVGIEKAIWITSNDEKVRTCHRRRDGKEFDLNKGCFSSCDNKFLYPGTDYNCRCVMNAVITDFED